MDHYRLLIYLVGWRIYMNMLVMSAAAFFFINFILWEDSENASYLSPAPPAPVAGGPSRKRSQAAAEPLHEQSRAAAEPSREHSQVAAQPSRKRSRVAGGPSCKRSRADFASEFLGVLKESMIRFKNDLAMIMEKLPNTPKGGLVQELKTLGLTEDEELDVIVQIARNPPYERLFWELQGEQRKAFVRRIIGR